MLAFFVIVGSILFAVLNHLFVELPKKEREKKEGKLQEKKRKEDFEASLERSRQFRQEVDDMIYQSNKAYYDKKAIRDAKAAEKLYYNPVYEQIAKYQHNGSRYVIFDLETTGLDPARHQITEMAAVRYIDDQPVEKFHRLVKIRDGTRITPRITELTGITKDMLDADGVHLSAAINDFIAFIADDCVMSYNIEFDVGFIEAAYKKALPNRKKCIYKLAKKRWRNRYSYKLTDIIDEESISSIEGSHRAMKDVELAHHLLTYIAYGF